MEHTEIKLLLTDEIQRKLCNVPQKNWKAETKIWGTKWYAICVFGGVYSSGII